MRQTFLSVNVHLWQNLLQLSSIFAALKWHNIAYKYSFINKTLPGNICEVWSEKVNMPCKIDNSKIMSYSSLGV